MARKKTQTKEVYIKTNLVTFKLSDYMQHTFMEYKTTAKVGWFSSTTTWVTDRKCVRIWFVDEDYSEFNFDTEEEAENFYEAIQRQLK